MTISFENIKQYHDELQPKILQYLKEKDCESFSFTYHDHMPIEFQNMLRFNKDSLTATHIRTKEDWVIIHRPTWKVFIVDFKTCKVKRSTRNMALEAMPLAVHKQMSDVFHVDCLYCYWDPAYEFECGFWMNSFPKIDVIMFPPTDPPEREEIEKTIFEGVFGIQRFQDIFRTVSGSPDPFALISFEEQEKMKHWKDCIGDFLGQ
jgi:hypothetical protein